MNIDWTNLYKVRLSSSYPSMQKHEVVKTLLVMKLLHHNKKDRNRVRIYTEQELSNGTICDVYFENVRTKSIVMYEIQKKYTKQWLEKKKEEYSKVKDYFMNTDFIPINLNECPENISEINNWLDQYVV